MTKLLHNIAQYVTDCLECLRFFTRLPIPTALDKRFSTQAHFPNLLWASPIAGAVIGTIGATILMLAHTLELPSLIAACAAIFTIVVITGALHEDGLADTIDGLFGGTDRENKLHIMKDSHIGTFGVCALIFSISGRIFALAAITESTDAMIGALSLIAACSLSRTTGLVLPFTMPPARASGLAHFIGKPSLTIFIIAFILALLINLILLLPIFHFTALIGIWFLCGLTVITFRRFIAQQLGGQTGDTIGAIIQLTEIVFLIGILIFLPEPFFD